MTGPINIGPTSMGDFLRSRIDPKLSRFGVRRLIAPGSYQARRENEKSKVAHEGMNGRWAAVGGLLPEQFWQPLGKIRRLRVWCHQPGSRSVSYRQNVDSASLPDNGLSHWQVWGSNWGNAQGGPPEAESHAPTQIC